MGLPVSWRRGKRHSGSREAGSYVQPRSVGRRWRSLDAGEAGLPLGPDCHGRRGQKGGEAPTATRAVPIAGPRKLRPSPDRAQVKRSAEPHIARERLPTPGSPCQRLPPISTWAILVRLVGKVCKSRPAPSPWHPLLGLIRQGFGRRPAASVVPAYATPQPTPSLFEGGAVVPGSQPCAGSPSGSVARCPRFGARAGSDVSPRCIPAREPLARSTFPRECAVLRKE
jgi:hypothetical protein